MSENEPGDNDADKRPRMYGRAVSSESMVEVTVKGSEGETTADIEGRFHDAVDHMQSAQEDLPTEEDEGDEKTFQ